MSIIIVAMTDTMMMVASDSRMLGVNTTNETTPKIYQYSQTLAAYGMGNAGIVMGLFEVFNNIKKKFECEFSYQNAVDTIKFWKKFVETSPEYVDIFGAIGVCGLNNGKPEATTVLVDSGQRSSYSNATKPNGGLTFYILPPSDLTNDMCNRAFIANCQEIRQPITLNDLILASSKTIADLCQCSKAINGTTQYWSFDLIANKSETKLFDLPCVLSD